ncbi:MAG TPA: polysaccharide deacetylase family protein [Gaiellaceae bacterium]|nr:polysaccharide deacetylase family protein [Gaiellaceae bacterium]
MQTRAIAGALLAIAILTGWTWPAPHAPSPRAALVLPDPLPQRRLVVPILMYHRIGPEPHGPAITDTLTVLPAMFASEMLWLRAAGYDAVTPVQLFDALEHGARLPRRPVVITFDDGYRDVLWNAAPLLRRLHMRATAFVITGRLSGPDSSFLTWAELRALERDGFTIGSHTVHHLELTRLPRRVAFSELVASRRALERHLGHAVPWLAYPAGRENAAVVALARRAGYVLAVTTAAGDVQSAQRPLELQRYEIADATGVRGLAALLGR